MSFKCLITFDLNNSYSSNDLGHLSAGSANLIIQKFYDKSLKIKKTYVNLKASEVMIPDSSSFSSLTEFLSSKLHDVKLIKTADKHRVSHSIMCPLQPIMSCHKYIISQNITGKSIKYAVLEAQVGGIRHLLNHIEVTLFRQLQVQNSMDNMWWSHCLVTYLALQL